MKKTEKVTNKKPFHPAKSLEERENQMISLAVDCAEQQLRDGTASAQVICHYLKLGSTRERLEKDIMKERTELLKSKTEMINSNKRTEELYAKALSAMKIYSGEQDDEDDYDTSW